MRVPAYLDSISGGLIACQAIALSDDGRQVTVEMTARNYRELGFSRIERFSARQIVPRDKVRGRVILAV